MLYWPESESGQQIDCVGYNHAIGLTRKALGEYISSGAGRFHVYYNFPYHPSPRALNKCGLPLVAFTMYESTRLPETFVNFLNKHVAAIVVPSQFCAEVFKNCGVTTPMAVMSLGVDTSAIKPVPRKKSDGYYDQYTYLWQGVAYDRGGRKGVDVVVDAFRKLKAEGRISKSARLILKYRHTNDGPILFGRNELPSGIIHISQDLTRQQLMNLYGEVDCCVNPTHGEGFGLIPLEQAAMGKPVIVTPWSVPYFDDKYFFRVDYDLATSPVKWNHRFFCISANGAEFNLFGLYTKVKFMPKLLNEMPDGRRVRPFPNRRVGFKEAAIGTMNNLARSAQLKLGLYPVPSRKAVTLFEEFPGNDAHVRVDSLCDVMEWCHNNRAEAARRGAAAADYVRTHWSLEHMKREFKANVIPLLEGISHE